MKSFTSWHYVWVGFLGFFVILLLPVVASAAEIYDVAPSVHDIQTGTQIEITADWDIVDDIGCYDDPDYWAVYLYNNDTTSNFFSVNYGLTMPTTGTKPVTFIFNTSGDPLPVNETYYYSIGVVCNDSGDADDFVQSSTRVEDIFRVVATTTPPAEIAVVFATFVLGLLKFAIVFCMLFVGLLLLIRVFTPSRWLK